MSRGSESGGTFIPAPSSGPCVTASRDKSPTSEQDARGLADRLGWTLSEIIVENDVSAFKRRAVRLRDGHKGARSNDTSTPAHRVVKVPYGPNRAACRAPSPIPIG